MLDARGAADNELCRDRKRVAAPENEGMLAA